MNGESGAIHVTDTVYHQLKDRYWFQERGLVNVKGKDEVQTYFLTVKNKDRLPQFPPSMVLRILLVGPYYFFAVTYT